MSREARDWVWSEAPVEDAQRLLVLLSLADVANEAGESYPSVGRMAQEGRCSGRTVQRHLKTLVQTQS